MKVAEGCDRACGFCAIPSFRGPAAEPDDRRRSSPRWTTSSAAGCARSSSSPRTSPPTDATRASAERRIVPLVEAVAAHVDWVRLLYLYPVDLTDELERVLCEVAVPYVDLSLQHVSRPLLRRMRRWGDGDRFLDRIGSIRPLQPEAAFRSNFIVGYPGETEDDHDELLRVRRRGPASTGAGSSPTREEDGTYAAGLDDRVAAGLVGERLAELRELQDAITAAKRDELRRHAGPSARGRPGRRPAATVRHRRSTASSPFPSDLPVGEFVDLVVTGAAGPDLEAVPA